MALRDNPDSLMAQQVVHRCDEKGGGVSELAESVIAFRTEQSTNFSSLVVMVNMQVLGAMRRVGRITANCASSILGGKQGVVLFGSDAVVPLKDPLPLKGYICRAFIPSAIQGTIAGLAYVTFTVNVADVGRKLNEWLLSLAIATDFGNWIRRWNLLARRTPVSPDSVKADLLAAPRASDIAPAVSRHNSFLGRLGHFVKCLRNWPIWNSLQHQPQGTLMEGLPPGCFAGVFDFMEVSI